MRPGVTLIEVTVSLLLVLILLSVGSLVARRSISTVGTVSTVELRSGARSDGLRTLTRHLINTDPQSGDLRIARDSVLDLVHTIGVGSICRANRDTVILSAPDAALPWSTTLPRGVTSDDAVRIWSDGDQRWLQRSVRSVTAAAGLCGDSTATWPGRAGQRLILDDTITNAGPGAFLRVLQRERWSLVRGGDGQWSLSLATWNAIGRSFSTPQPLVTPLAAPTARGGPGFAVRAFDVGGRPITDSALSRTRAVDVRLSSAPHQRFGAHSDSVRINVGPH